MNNRPAEQSFGWNLGIVSGLFAALQVMISTSTARANIASIESMRWAMSRLDSGGGNPLPLIGSLAPVVLITYLSMIITGAICLTFCWYAGRLTAYVRGSRDGGAGAGFRVALLSGLIWIAFSVIFSAFLHADGTISGVFASTHDGSSWPAQISGLLVQELIFGGIGLGLGAWAGHLGSRSAPMPSEAPPVAPMIAPVAYGVYPAHPAYPVYPTYPAYPVYPAYPPAAGYPGYGGYPVATPPYPSPYPPHSAQPAPDAAQTPADRVSPSYPPPPNFYHTADHAATPQEPQGPQESPGPQLPDQNTPQAGG